MLLDLIGELGDVQLIAGAEDQALSDYQDSQKGARRDNGPAEASFESV